MDDWLNIPKDRNRLPVGRLCVIMALTVLLLLAIAGRKSALAAEAGLWGGLAVPGLCCPATP
jgi:hypothetical protein